MTSKTLIPLTNYGKATCNHIFDDAHRCGSPAMRGEQFCYFHHPERRPIANPYARRSRRGFDLPAPVDQRSLHAALTQVIVRLAANKLDVHRAGLLLYSLQIASHTLPYSASPVPTTSPSD